MTRDTSVPVKLVPESVPDLRDPNKSKVFTKAQLDFLRNYAECMDEDQAITEAGLDRRRLAEFQQNPYIVAEMQKIQEVWQCQVRMTSGYAAGKHMQIMDKVEGLFDGAEKHEDKGRYANTLAKMSEASMKATGLIGTKEQAQVPTVIFNIDTGGGDANVQVNQQNITESPAHE